MSQVPSATSFTATAAEGRAGSRPAMRGQPGAGAPTARRRPRAGTERPRLVAFFAAIYYAGLRPEEAVSLRKDNITISPLVGNPANHSWEEPADNWGELRFSAAAPEAGAEWTDDGQRRDHRHLKSRARSASGAGCQSRRPNPHPPRPSPRVRDRPRRARLRPAPRLRVHLAQRRHPPAQVAERTGHSVAIQLKIYAKCLGGQDAIAKRRIEEVPRAPGEPAPPKNGSDEPS